MPKPGSGPDTRCVCALDDGRQAGGGDDLSRETDLGEEDAPGTAETDPLGKVVAEICKQWGIECQFKDFERTIMQLLKLRIIDRPIDILHSECWERCTSALAKDVIASGTAKCLKSCGKVTQALEKELTEQETWKAAQRCLKITPKVGVGTATQTNYSDCFMNSELPPETNNRLRSRSQSPPPSLIRYLTVTRS